MIKSTLIAAATVLAVTAGSLAAGTTGASAQPYGGPSVHGNWQRHHGPKQICKPVFRTVKVHGPRGWQIKKVAVGQRCAFVRSPRHW